MIQLLCNSETLSLRNFVILKQFTLDDMRGSRGGQGVWTPSGKSQVAIGFHRNTGMDPQEKQLDPLGPIASRGRSILSSVKYVKKVVRTPSPWRYFRDPRMDDL